MEYKIRKTDLNIDIIEMKNEEIEVHVTPLGCIIISIFTKDKFGKMEDIVLGFDDLSTYQNQDKYIGAIVGRCAGRIKDGQFNLNGKDYKLAQNSGDNTLHGGIVGFDQKVFDYEMFEDGVRFHYVSNDGEEGFPGTLDLYITYTLFENKLIACYEATCDQDTIVNITNHSYFNLQGKGTVLNHELMIHSDEILCSDEGGCANGVRQPVKQTPFDFNEMKVIGKDIDKEDPQLAIGSGYDHYFIFDERESALILKDPISGRIMEVSTNQAGAQIYTANFLDGALKGKNNWYFNQRDAICIETQAAPNAIHIEKEPTTILKAGNKYCSQTNFEFKIESGEITK